MCRCRKLYSMWSVHRVTAARSASVSGLGLGLGVGVGVGVGFGCLAVRRVAARVVDVLHHQRVALLDPGVEGGDAHGDRRALATR